MLPGKDIILRPWKDSDLPVLMGLRNDLALQAQLMTQPRPNSSSRVVKWLQEKSEKPDGVFFIVASTQGDGPLGYVQIHGIDLQSRHCHMGICLAREAQGKGYGHQVLTLIEQYMRSVFGMRKIMLEVLLSNAPAIKLYERYGFDRVGVMKSHFQADGVFADVLIMEKLG